MLLLLPCTVKPAREKRDGSCLSSRAFNRDGPNSEGSKEGFSPTGCLYQCLESTSSGRRLSFFRVSYPTTMTMVEGVAEMMRAERPLVRPQGPSSAMSCLKVRMMELLPSTCKGRTNIHRAARLHAELLWGSALTEDPRDYGPASPIPLI